MSTIKIINLWGDHCLGGKTTGVVIPGEIEDNGNVPVCSPTCYDTSYTVRDSKVFSATF